MNAYYFSKNQPLPKIGEEMILGGITLGVVTSVEELRRWVRVTIQ